MNLYPKRLSLVLALTVLATLATSGPTAQAANKPTAKAAPTVAAKLYVCSMCDFATDKPGKCPKCGMNLEEVNKADVSYVCDMCKVTSDKPGKCPKCGMELKMKVATPKAPAPKASQPQKG